MVIDQHVASGKICLSASAYVSPSFVVPKVDSSALPQWVCDYCCLNDNIRNDAFPLP